MKAETERLLTEVRVLVRDHLHVATCVGCGPRFQHSTGQAYKGGPNTGVFLQLTCRDTIELPVPGHRYTFGVVKEAQARGDFDALAANGRRALRIDLGADTTAGLTVLKDTVKEVVRNATQNQAAGGNGCNWGWSASDGWAQISSGGFCPPATSVSSSTSTGARSRSWRPRARWAPTPRRACRQAQYAPGGLDHGAGRPDRRADRARPGGADGGR
jgi:hypothetical protein